MCEGATKTAAVSTALLNDLVTRGFADRPGTLLLIDGASALRRAISDIYGSLGVVQRCQLHYADLGMRTTMHELLIPASESEEGAVAISAAEMSRIQEACAEASAAVRKLRKHVRAVDPRQSVTTVSATTGDCAH